MRMRHYYKSGQKAKRSTNYFAKEGVKLGTVNEDMREDEERAGCLLEFRDESLIILLTNIVDDAL